MSRVVLRLPKVTRKTGLSRSTIYRRIAEGKFPKPIQLGTSRSVGWLEADIEQWIETQISLTNSEEELSTTAKKRVRRRLRK